MLFYDQDRTKMRKEGKRRSGKEVERRAQTFERQLRLAVVVVVVLVGLFFLELLVTPASPLLIPALAAIATVQYCWRRNPRLSAPRLRTLRATTTVRFPRRSPNFGSDDRIHILSSPSAIFRLRLSLVLLETEFSLGRERPNTCYI